MKVEVSIGEAIDKLSILQIKYQNINDENKRIEIQKEINVLQECNKYKDDNLFFYNLLVYINQKIWDLTDIIKKMEKDNSEFSNISKQIFDNNQKRFRIKNWFNLLTYSEIKEQKSYDLTTCKIIIDEEETIYNKIAEINFLLLEYDIILVSTHFMEIIQKIFKKRAYSFINNSNIERYKGNYEIILKKFVIPENETKKVFEFIPLKYISGGAFGDFIQQLSVINEKFYETGRKGILYISEGGLNKDAVDYGDKFLNGLENTYNDTYSVIKNQIYIYDYKIYNNELYDINLNEWRSNSNLYNQNWYYTYKQTYNIEWGKHQWINTDINSLFEERIIINTTHYRWCDNIDFNKLYSLYGNKLLYISNDINQYRYFTEKTSLNIEYYKMDSFYDLCLCINSCKLFIGSQSAPLALANALHKERICGLHNCNIEKNLMLNLYVVFDNIKYEI